MKVLLTGANGQLGRAIQNEYGNEAEFIRTDMIDDPSLVRLDISDANAVEACVKDTAPDVIINCAAFTNVDGCETNEALAYEANAIGPRNLAYVSAQAGIRLVHISTDYVFAGDASRPSSAPGQRVRTDEAGGGAFCGKVCKGLLYPAHRMALRRR